jgi:hypothetical protein
MAPRGGGERNIIEKWYITFPVSVSALLEGIPFHPPFPPWRERVWKFVFAHLVNEFDIFYPASGEFKSNIAVFVGTFGSAGSILGPPGSQIEPHAAASRQDSLDFTGSFPRGELFGTSGSRIEPRPAASRRASPNSRDPSRVAGSISQHRRLSRRRRRLSSRRRRPSRRRRRPSRHRCRPSRRRRRRSPSSVTSPWSYLF